MESIRKYFLAGMASNEQKIVPKAYENTTTKINDKTKSI
jgi:hypothetical protein